jgi:hypothetical protein
MATASDLEKVDVDVDRLERFIAEHGKPHKQGDVWRFGDGASILLLPGGRLVYNDPPASDGVVQDILAECRLAADELRERKERDARAYQEWANRPRPHHERLDEFVKSQEGVPYVDDPRSGIRLWANGGSMQTLGDVSQQAGFARPFLPSDKDPVQRLAARAHYHHLTLAQLEQRRHELQVARENYRLDRKEWPARLQEEQVAIEAVVAGHQRAFDRLMALKARVAQVMAHHEGDERDRLLDEVLQGEPPVPQAGPDEPVTRGAQAVSASWGGLM